MQALSFDSITVDEIDLPVAKKNKCQIAVLRLDKIHPIISGNKWFKLSCYLKQAQQESKKKILTFGGSYSNHVVATAAACQLLGLVSYGIIRGEKPKKISSSLEMAEACGMELQFVDRHLYREKMLPTTLDGWEGEYYRVPAGGYGPYGVEGAAEILNYCDLYQYTHIACAVGTGTMLAGLIKAGNPLQKIIGVSVFRNNFSLDKELHHLLSGADKEKQFEIWHDDLGRYARASRFLLSFMNDFFQQTAIPLDFVYTGKLVYSVICKMELGFFPSGSNILLIHSGGLQGNLSLSKGTLIY